MGWGWELCTLNKSEDNFQKFLLSAMWGLGTKLGIMLLDKWFFPLSRRQPSFP